MYERMHLLNKEDFNKLHDATMEILTDIGIAFHEAEAIEIFKQSGVKTDGNIVYLEEQDVRHALDSAPSQFQINARNPEKSVTIGGDHLVIAPGYGTAFMVGPNGDRRDAVMEDYDNFCKLVHTSKYIDMNGCLMVEPSDIPPDIVHLNMIFSNIVLCDKPFLGSPVSRQAAIDSIEMAGIVWGNEKIKKEPVMMAIISTASPLQYAAEMAGAIIEYARNGQALMIGGLMLAGGTGPVTLPGLIALHNAEILGGITLAQMVNPGVPVVYGTTSSIIEMKTGSLSVGAPELSIIQNATIQMAKYYGLSARGTGGVTDAHFPDIQAGIESAVSLTMTVLSGVNFILHACGILSSYLAMSYVKFLADEELCGMLRRIIQPLNVTDERINLNAIKEVGIGGEYLSHDSTFDNCRKEFYMPRLMNRLNYASWLATDKKRFEETSTASLSQRLAYYEKPDIDLGIERDLASFVARRKSEYLEHKSTHFQYEHSQVLPTSYI